MRELIGKVALSEPGVTRSVYRSELIRCGECQRMGPIGIEVITARRDGDSQKVRAAKRKTSRTITTPTCAIISSAVELRRSLRFP
jgi:hypothetical protein